MTINNSVYYLAVDFGKQNSVDFASKSMIDILKNLK